MKKYYGSDTKNAYIEQMEAGGNSVSETAKEWGITENTFYNWKRKLRDAPKRGRLQEPDMEYPRKTVNENVRPKRSSEKERSISRKQA